MPMRPCWVEISTRALEENYRYLETLAPRDAELLAIVKADAYGHGLTICVSAFARSGAGWLGVTSVEEGVAARTVCPGARILVIGSVFPGQAAAVIEHRLTPVVWERWQFDELEAACRAAAAGPNSIPFHLELDTGMNRQGLALDDRSAGLESVLAHFSAASPLRLEGVMTHLYAADEADGAATGEQLARLDRALVRIGELGHWAEYLNVGNSAALLAGQGGTIVDVAASHGMKALLRPGLALYGLAPRFEPEEPAAVTAARGRLRPALTWRSRVVGVRRAAAGATVGYNGTFVVAEPMQLALVALGYADGLDRRLGNCFSLLVRGERAPIVGRISMDQTVLDVTEIAGVEPGAEVVVIGQQGEQAITAYDHADACGTIPWEVFTRISARVKRRAV